MATSKNRTRPKAKRGLPVVHPHAAEIAFPPSRIKPTTSALYSGVNERLFMVIYHLFRALSLYLWCPPIPGKSKLHHVVNDITGKTAMRIIRDIIAGERDPHKLAQRYLADLGHSLFCIPEPKRLKIRERRVCGPNGNLGHRARSARAVPLLRIDLEVSERDDILGELRAHGCHLGT